MEILIKHSNRTYKKVTAFLIMVHTCRESINTGLNYIPEWWNSGLIKTDKIRIPDLPSSIIMDFQCNSVSKYYCQYDYLMDLVNYANIEYMIAH